MQEASMSLQSMAVLLPYKESPVTNSQLHRFNRSPKPAGPRWNRRRLLVTNGAPHGRESSKELKLDQQDMMAIEFGRLLGESKEKTISKVLRRKIDPNSTFIGLEKEAKAGKELFKNTDFAMKVERPRGASKNGSMLGPDVPRLASPPSRPYGILPNLPKAGVNADAQGILDDSLLRKPLSIQSSKAVSSIMPSTSLAANNAKRPGPQSMKSMEEERSVNLDLLRRPSLDKEGNALKESNLVISPKSVSKSAYQSSRPGTTEMRESSDSMEASKLEFQHLLDKPFNTAAEPESPRAVESSLSSESTAQDGSRLADVAAALPNLASRPSRHSGSIGTFMRPAQKECKETHSMKMNPPNDTVDESLLRKPGAQASDDVTSLSAQSSEEFCSSHNYQSLMPPNLKELPVSHEASAIPQLTSPPSRDRGSLGKFLQSRKTKVQDPVDSFVDESLLRKPSIDEKVSVSMINTPLAKDTSTPLSTSEQAQLKDVILDDNLLPRPPIMPSTTEVDNKSALQEDGLKQGAIGNISQMCATLNDALSIDSEKTLPVGDGSNIGDEVLEPVMKFESSAQSHEQLAEPMTSNALKDAREGANELLFMAKSGRSKDVDNGSGVKRVKVAALKKPARVTLSDPSKGPVFQEREDIISGNIDGSNDSKMISVVEERVDTSLKLNKLCPEREGMMPRDLDDSNDSKMVLEVEESADTSLRLNNLIGNPSNLLSIAPEEASFEDQGREQEEQLSVASGTEQTKSMNMLRKPSISAHGSELTILEASNPKLHHAKEEEEKDWIQAEALLKAKEQVEVKMIGSNSAGLFVSLGCLVGFLPSFELSPKRGLVDFSSWAQHKGYGMSQKKAANGANEGGGLTQNVKESKLSTETDGELNDLRNKYREEVSKLMSSFVGEKTKVVVKLLDKGRRKLRVSEKEADLGCQEVFQKKANLMAVLKLGEVVTCQVKSITPIGVFVEVDGVPALIHHSEVSWNTRLDPASLLRVGEVIKAKVCRLDRTLQRINLSLKQMQTDPLKRTLESVVGDLDNNNSIHAVEETATLEVSWPELGELIRKLEQMDHISSVLKGRCLYSAAFAPSFQVLISTPQSKGYKLLARFENKIQEILVDTTLQREKMKECIRRCTFSEA